VSKEDGSGTRGAFVEFEIVEKDAYGNRIDHTTDETIVVNSTSIVMNSVAGNEKGAHSERHGAAGRRRCLGMADSRRNVL